VTSPQPAGSREPGTGAAAPEPHRVTDSLSDALAAAGPHTAASLAARLPAFPPDAIAAALEALTAQGVLTREVGPEGEPAYRYTAPEQYQQANLDVIRDPGTGIKRRPR
jgi:hypothetical protein